MIKRNLFLYFRNRSGIIFSLLGALISFILYLIFLKKGIASNWTQIDQKNQLLDTWLISGTLAITGITTTLASLTQLVKDKETHVLEDLLLTDAGAFKIQAGYVISATIVGIIMQIVMLTLMGTYFIWTDKITLPWNQIFNILGVIVLSSFLATLVNSIIVKGIKTVDSLGKLATIISTAAGFLVGTYMPIGSLPNFAQTLMKITPGTYVAALYRQIFMKTTLQKVFGDNVTNKNNFNKIMGVKINWSGLLTTQQTYAVIISIVTVAFILVVLSTLGYQKHTKKLLKEY